MIKSRWVSLLLAFAICAQGALPTGARPCEVQAPALRGYFTLGVTGLYWETANDDYRYALTYRWLDDEGNVILNDGHFRSSNPDSRWNFKANVGYIFPCTGNEVRLNYIDYHQDTHTAVFTDIFNRLIVPALSEQWPTLGVVTVGNTFFGLTDFLVPLTTLPDGSVTVIPVEPNLATAAASINLNVFDLNFSQAMSVGSNTRIKYNLGLRYSKINNGFDVIYNFSGTNPTDILVPSLDGLSAITVNLSADLTEVIKQKTEYRGVGPQLGVDFNYYLNWGFGFVSSISTSLLVGSSDTFLSDQFIRTGLATTVASTATSIPVGTVFDTSITEQANYTSNNDARIVPNIDIKLGLDYTYDICNASRQRVTIEAGYMVSHYFNAVDRVTALVLTDNDNSPKILDIHFDGFYVGIQWNI